jgi:hypothetical protein
MAMLLLTAISLCGKEPVRDWRIGTITDIQSDTKTTTDAITGTNDTEFRTYTIVGPDATYIVQEKIWHTIVGDTPPLSVDIGETIAYDYQTGSRSLVIQRGPSVNTQNRPYMIT